jgi:hypothetical protein
VPARQRRLQAQLAQRRVQLVFDVVLVNVDVRSLAQAPQNQCGVGAGTDAQHPAGKRIRHFPQHRQAAFGLRGQKQQHGVRPVLNGALLGLVERKDPHQAVQRTTIVVQDIFHTGR